MRGCLNKKGSAKHKILLWLRIMNGVMCVLHHFYFLFLFYSCWFWSLSFPHSGDTKLSFISSLHTLSLRIPTRPLSPMDTSTLPLITVETQRAVCSQQALVQSTQYHNISTCSYSHLAASYSFECLFS